MIGTERKQLGVKISFFRLGGLKGVRRRTTGIGNTNVKSSKMGLDGGYERCNCRRISDIESLMEDFATGRFFDLSRGLAECSESAGTNGNVSAFASQLLSDSAFQAFTSSLDYHHATI